MSNSSPLDHAVQIAVTNVHQAGGPFGAVLVMPDGTRYEGVNRVTANNDPTAHAEVMAIRNACAAEGTFSLEGAVLYSSCEPCPMCLASSMWARVSKVYFAADRYDAADAGFDDLAFYEAIEGGKTGEFCSQDPNISKDSATAPFATWGDQGIAVTEY